MQIKQITDNNFKEEWDEFVIKNSSPAAFLQSWEWGEFKKTREHGNTGTLLRFGVFENGELVAVAQFLKVGLPAGKFYLNCAYGPVAREHLNTETREHIYKLIISEIKNISKKENIIFIRFAPTDKQLNNEAMKQLGFVRPKILTNLIEPENTLVLNLKKNEEELLKEMHQKTRYNIRLAERKKININYHLSNISEKEINNFYELTKATAERDKINIFNKEYYKSLLLTPHSLLFTAEHGGQVLSTIILIGFGDTCTYLYGASSNEKRNLMPNYLIQWEAIKWAKENGFKYYDFWGINPHENTKTQKHKNTWSGITRFKKGFVSEKTGREINYIGAYDFVLNKKWYNLYRVGKIAGKILKK